MPGTRMEIEEYPAKRKWEGMVEALDGSRNTRIIRVTASTASEALERIKEATNPVSTCARQRSTSLVISIMRSVLTCAAGHAL